MRLAARTIAGIMIVLLASCGQQAAPRPRPPTRTACMRAS